MPRQRAIRFPDDLDAAIEAKAKRLGHPHTFSSVIVNAARRDVGQLDVAAGEALVRAVEAREAAAQVRADGEQAERERLAYPMAHPETARRGSPSPSLERFGGKQ